MPVLDALASFSYAASLAGLGMVAFLLVAVHRHPQYQTARTFWLGAGLTALAVQSAAAASSAAGAAAIALSLALDGLVAPALYLHLVAIAEPRRRPRAVHALLPLATILSALSLALVGTPGEPPTVRQALAAVAVVVTAAAVTVAQGVYLVAGFRRVRAVEEQQPGALPWTRRLIVLSATIYGLGIVATVSALAGLLPDAAARAAELPTTIVHFAFGLGAIADLGVFKVMGQTVAAPAPKYARSALSEAEAAALVARAARALDRDALFADPLLSLPRLAAAAGAKPGDLSQALNRVAGGYADFLARRRIAEACRMLKAEPTRPVVEISVAVGFNAKSTFHSAFQRIVGTTPAATGRTRRRSAISLRRCRGQPCPEIELRGLGR